MQPEDMDEDMQLEDMEETRARAMPTLGQPEVCSDCCVVVVVFAWQDTHICHVCVGSFVLPLLLWCVAAVAVHVL